MSPEDLTTLIDALERRLTIIADSEMREQDPARQLTLLQEVSEEISTFHEQHREEIPVRLDHFLKNCSFDKALTWARKEFGAS